MHKTAPIPKQWRFKPKRLIVREQRLLITDYEGGDITTDPMDIKKIIMVYNEQLYAHMFYNRWNGSTPFETIFQNMHKKQYKIWIAYVY